MHLRSAGRAGLSPQHRQTQGHRAPQGPAVLGRPHELQAPGRRGTRGRATAIRALMRSGAQERKGQHGWKGPCPGPRGLSPKPAGARRGCPRAPCLATLVITGASALSSCDSGKRTHECSKLSSPTAPRTPSPAELGLNPPKEEPASERGNRRKGTQHRSSL